MFAPFLKKRFYVASIFITALLVVPPISAEQWVPVGNLDIPYAGETCLTSGNNGIPYLITETAGVMKFDGSQWIDIGKPLAVTNLYVKTLAIANDGTPYVLYEKYPSYFVDKFENGQWVNIGGDLEIPSGIEDSSGGFNLAIASNNTLYIAYTDGISAPERIVLTKFNGTEWVNVSEIVEEEHDLSLETGGLDLATDDTPYIAYADPNYANRLTVVKFDGQQWIVVGQPGFSSDPVGYNGVELTLTNNDALYVNYTSDTNSKNTVMKLSNNQWITVGSADFADAYGLSRLDLEVASDGVPYVAFDDNNSRKAKVMKFDGSEWVMVGDSVSVGESSTVCLTLINGTTPYVSYRDYEDSYSYRAVVKKLESEEEVCADSHAQYSLGTSKLLIPFVDVPLFNPETHKPTGEIAVFKAKLELKNGNFILNRVWDTKSASPDEICHAYYSDQSKTLKIPFVDVPSAGVWPNFKEGLPINVFEVTLKHLQNHPLNLGEFQLQDYVLLYTQK